MRNLLVFTTVLLTVTACSIAAKMPSEKYYVNSIGMKFVRIEPGSFDMGNAQGGDFDEIPVHKVNITRPFYMGVYEVTNEQYEQFDKTHKYFRGRKGLSRTSNSAAIFVDWNQAKAFCKWLSKNEGLPYRLPTEAQWEYACRAGTTTQYSTGDELPKISYKSQQRAWDPNVVDLTVGMGPANPWGLYDMHGNVEEWCEDWYGPYVGGEQKDPVGRFDGDFRVTRSGSHNTPVEYLRSANRLGTLPEDKHWLIGFRVVIGKMPKTRALPVEEKGLWSQNVSQKKYKWQTKEDVYFEEPRRFMTIPKGTEGEIWGGHNHQPAITACPNGDIMTIWYSTTSEEGRNLTVVASRLRQGSDAWEMAAPFWDGPDRNDHGSSILWEGEKTIYHFNGLGTSGTWAKLALIMRTSTDNGVNWTKARIIQPIHGLRHQVIQGSFITKEGYIIVPCDAVTEGSGGTAVHVSKDGGLTFNDPGENRPKPRFKPDRSGAWIAGIHAGCVQLKDGSLMAFGRSNRIEGRMPMSISTNMGENWNYYKSEFPGIGSGKRMVLLRLKSGGIFLGSLGDGKLPLITDESGAKKPVKGLYGAISYDEGKTWPFKRLISDDSLGTERQYTDGATFIMDRSQGEPRGYFAVTQSPDGVIHLISSWNHYAFNEKWLETAPPAEMVNRTGK